jgi:phage shock protein PspC (stress-responsive transcriptional regulator)
MSMTTHLYRSRDDRMLAGVAGGLAELWDADPSLVRLVWALLVIFTGGIALVVYIVMAIVVPEEDDPRAYLAQPPVGAPPLDPTLAGPAAAGPTTDLGAAPVPPPPSIGMPMTPAQARYEAREARHRARAMRRAARGDRPHSGAIIVGVLFVLFGVWFLVREYLPSFDWDWFWPATLVLLGVVVLVFALRPGSNDTHGSTGAPGTPS